MYNVDFKYIINFYLFFHLFILFFITMLFYHIFYTNWSKSIYLIYLLFCLWIKIGYLGILGRIILLVSLFFLGIICILNLVIIDVLAGVWIYLLFGFLCLRLLSLNGLGFWMWIRCGRLEGWLNIMFSMRVGISFWDGRLWCILTRW